MLLCLDIGNTNIVMGITDNTKIIEKYRFATNTLITEDEYAVKFIECIKGSKYSVKDITGVIISSVVPSLDVIMKSAFEKYKKFVYINCTEDFTTTLKHCDLLSPFEEESFKEVVKAVEDILKI